MRTPTEKGSRPFWSTRSHGAANMLRPYLSTCSAGSRSDSNTNPRLLYSSGTDAETISEPPGRLHFAPSIDPKAIWLIAEGADSLAVSRSVPMKKAYDDAMVALYRPGQAPPRDSRAASEEMNECRGV